MKYVFWMAIFRESPKCSSRRTRRRERSENRLLQGGYYFFFPLPFKTTRMGVPKNS